MESEMVIPKGGRCNGDGDGKIQVKQTMKGKEIEMKMAPGHGQEGSLRGPAMVVEVAPTWSPLAGSFKYSPPSINVTPLRVNPL